MESEVSFRPYAHRTSITRPVRGNTKKNRHVPIRRTRLTRKKAGNIGKQAVVGHGKHMGVVDTGEDERLMAVGDDEEKLLALVVNRHDVYLGGGG